MIGCVSKLYDIDSVVIPAELLDMHVDDQKVETGLKQLAMRYSTECPAESVEKGDVVYAAPDADSYADGRVILLFTGVDMPGAEAAAQAVLGAKVGDVVQTQIGEQAVTLTVEKIVRRVPAPIDDDLAARMGVDGVTTVEDCRTYLREKAMEDIHLENSKEIAHIYVDALHKNSEYEYDRAAAEAYIDSVYDEYAAECAAYGYELSEEELRQDILAQKKQEWMIQAFCQAHGLEVDEAEVEAETEQMIEMMSLMGEDVSDRDKYVEMARSGAYANQFFMYIEKLAEEKMGGSHGNS